MSGKRTKALRRAFKKRYKRAPLLAGHYEHPVCGNEFRRWKKDWRAGQ